MWPSVHRPGDHERRPARLGGDHLLGALPAEYGRACAIAVIMARRPGSAGNDRQLGALPAGCGRERADLVIMAEGRSGGLEITGWVHPRPNAAAHAPAR
jgi:hypothetical protein